MIGRNNGICNELKDRYVICKRILKTQHLNLSGNDVMNRHQKDLVVQDGYIPTRICEMLINTKRGGNGIA